MNNIWTLFLLLACCTGTALAAEQTSPASELIGQWRGAAPDGTMVSYLFQRDGAVTWVVEPHPPIHARYDAQLKDGLVQIDIFDFDLPGFAGVRLMGIAKFEHNEMTFYGVPTKNGKNQDGTRATRPNQFPEDAIRFKRSAE